MKTKRTLAIAAGKFVYWLSRLSGNRGSSLPGLAARRICPGILPELAAQVRRGVIMITGTNGKTTTGNMIARVLLAAGWKVISNREGANLITGVTASFIRKSSLWGKIDCDYAVLEVDEASFPGVTAEVRPQIVVLTNFFRDQLDRYWEVDKIVGLINTALQKMPDARLVLNADDPLVAQFREKTGLSCTFYGLDGFERTPGTGDRVREARFCPFCGASLVYDNFYYSQLGLYRCPGCPFARPEAQVEAAEIVLGQGSTTSTVVYDHNRVLLTVPAPGLHNLYNALAAFSAGLSLKVEIESIIRALSTYVPVSGRMETFTYHEKPVYLNLVKNPAGFNEGLAALLNGKECSKDVLLAINDLDADGRDISWLWDVDFEVLAEAGRLSFFCTGRRGEEMALRLKYAGISTDRIGLSRDMRTAVRKALAGTGEKVYFYTTYTALWPVRKILSRMALEGNYDQNLPSLS
ncbi:MAG: Mur ligase family protein [Peptococcaceae bacterium]|nr:MAG: Mur ligase family protein [Peptococcaceae bacterium]